MADVLPLLNILNSFQEGRSHLAIVCPRKPGFHSNRPDVGPQAAGRRGSRSSSSGQGYDLVRETSNSSTSSNDANGSGDDDNSSRHRFRRMFRRKASRSISSADGKSLKSYKDNAEKAERGEMDIELSSKMALNIPLEEDMPMGIVSPSLSSLISLLA